MGKNWDKFRLLMWKNWVLQYRKPIQTAVEIIAPVLFSIILVAIRSLVDPELQQPRVYTPFCPVPITGICPPITNSDTLSRFRKQFLKDQSNSTTPNGLDYLKKYNLVYSPNTEELNRTLSPFNLVFREVVGVNTSRALENYFILNGNNTFAGFQFNDDLTNLTGKLEVSIRFPAELRTDTTTTGYVVNWFTNLVYPLFQVPGPRSPNSTTGSTPNYYNEGFLGLQQMVTWLLIAAQHDIKFPESNSTSEILAWWLQNQAKITSLNLPMIYMERFPYASWYDDYLISALESFVGLIIMLSFVYTCINTVRTITQEKEKQLKESMKIMGLPNWLHWLAWFIKVFTYLMISIILMVVLLKVRWYPNTNNTVFTNANFMVLLLFLLFYVCSTITFCFAVSVFFSKANTAAAMAGLFWFLTYAPNLFMAQSYDTLSLASKLLACLASNTCMGFGFQLIIKYEGTGEGVQWNNLWTPVSPDDDLTIGHLMLLFVVDTFLYLFIALYVEAVFPGEYGVPKPWNFIFSSSFWCGQPRYTGVENFEDPITENKFYEKEPQNLKPGIKIRNLKKVFGSKAAVKNLSINMFEDQITVLLGHNGAGKTTTMSMLTGMITPTTGTAVVNGHDIRSNIDGVRDSLGLCPQHNIIFDELTVAEHLYFFSKLKGVQEKDTEAEINKYVDLLELTDKKNKQSRTLSGGMKRKLCVGIALCGNSKVVMLDEPTAGMDPSARRALWDLMLKLKTGRTVLLSTHFMDEADLLGDRIAIMAGGELQCCGSSFFLKKKFGAGYHLVMDKSKRCDSHRVTDLLRRHIPNIEVESDIGSELTYLLSENQSSVFEPMLRDLETHGEQLGINSFGISLTTLEEVFMKVGADHEQEEINNEKQNGSAMNGNTNANGVRQTKVEIGLSSPPSNFELIVNQFHAMFLKKMLSTWRSWLLLAIQILVPVMFLNIVMLVSKAQGNTNDLPAMPLTLDKFSNPVSLAQVNSNLDQVTKLFDAYRLTAGNVEKIDDIHGFYMNLTESKPNTARRTYPVGAAFGEFEDSSGGMYENIFKGNVTAYFNNDAYHTPGISLALALNTAYKRTMDCGDTCSIDFINRPLPFSAESKVQRVTSGQASMGFNLSFNIGFSMAFVSSFYILFIVRERVTSSKHLQFVSGVKVSIFWITTYACDFLTYLLTISAYLITLVCYQEDGYNTAKDIGRMALILLYFGWSVLPMIYFAGFLFDVPSTGFTRMTLFSIFTGCAAFLIVTVLQTESLNLTHVARALHWIFLVIPHYSLASGVSDSFTLFTYNKLCNQYFKACWESNPHFTKDQCLALLPSSAASIRNICSDLDPNYFKWESPGIGRNILFSGLLGLVLFILLLVIDSKVVSRIMYLFKKRLSNQVPQPVEDEDSDVKAEKDKIRNTSLSQLNQDYTLILQDLTKYYKKHLAVNGLCLGVNKYECFGLLGVNGAGKTTTFKMMTGDISITYGNTWVKGFDVKDDIKNVQKQIGYCPQFDALLDDLTARETLKIFSLLRGLRTFEAECVAENLAHDFDFYKHLDKKVKELSGGNKRKLSTSLALIGDPPVVYLDEPTTGMDVATKRYLWNALCKVRDRGKCIVLTSHSMEECEALCTRLAIMVNGNFKCLGSIQHLKSKFAEGYSISIKLKKPENSSAGSHTSTEPIEQFIARKFIGAKLLEKHEELLTYYVTDKSTPWSRMFGILEEGKRQQDLNIEDYSIGQSSLEQVFLSFTKYQID